ncbi:DUF397 domain-containing protein [Streptomyces oceani]|uniref:Toxin n=1 Tax=Streptomyces oceani TaxID=1075402 RepID=A0A1E7KGU6_9ACTN|nr:DUF397 domain-containing protein [Streptomyces oceani]OEV03145.1 toxin [Streptomyces oceani]
MTLKRAVRDDSDLRWVKSSYSSNDGPECVEVAATADTVRVRDSKCAAGAKLAFPEAGWVAFAAYAAGFADAAR